MKACVLHELTRLKNGGFAGAETHVFFDAQVHLFLFWLTWPIARARLDGEMPIAQYFHTYLSSGRPLLEDLVQVGGRGP